jgi:hypothetical protein
MVGLFPAFHVCCILCLFCGVLKNVLSFSVFDCGGHPAWPLTTADNYEVMHRFQNWMMTFQHRCKPSNGDYWLSTIYGSGIGSGTTISVINMFKAFELGKIYRPTQSWLWAEVNATEHCVSGINAVDCFNVPLTYCYINPNASEIIPTLNINFTDADLFIDHPVDICTMAKVSQKTLLWVFGQFLHYHMRVPPHLEKFLELRSHQIFPKRRISDPPIIDPLTGFKCLTAAIQVRGGSPDFSRKPFDGTDHYRELLKMNKELSKTNQTICSVYVAGDHLDSTIFFPKTVDSSTSTDSAAMTPAYSIRNGSFIFKSLPHFIPAPGELEYQVLSLKKFQNVTMEYLYAEYLSDILLFSKADILIASFSNVFAVAAPLRVAYHPTIPNNRTCFLDSRFQPPPLKCLGTWDGMKFFKDAYGGFNGGSIFF